MRQGNKKHGCLTQLLISLGLIAVLIVGLLIIRAVKRSSRSKVPAGGINESLYVDINGTKQWINIYGQKKENPVLLFLEGGPGDATSIFGGAFNQMFAGDLDFFFFAVSWNFYDFHTVF